jgi:hypothetical protein
MIVINLKNSLRLSIELLYEPNLGRLRQILKSGVPLEGVGDTRRSILKKLVLGE